MEQQYALFVAYATLQAYEQLQHLLTKWRTDVTQEILTDAAKFGHQKATDRIFPGSIRLPFERAALKDILDTLKLQYGVAPGKEGGPVIDGTEETSRRLRSDRDGDPVTRLTDQIRTPASGHYRIQSASRVEGMQDTNRRISADGVEKLPMPDESSRHRVGSSNRLSKIATPHAGEPTARIVPTKLRTIATPAFPWEKKQE
ncbi:hypothetical protein IT570_00975 [Candidatus Sumerlaeota bacterium]|nr:hypothetical protein [Candidatus Sumerlaeota bacterium]